jgi:hypothetical protein
MPTPTEGELARLRRVAAKHGYRIVKMRGKDGYAVVNIRRNTMVYRLGDNANLVSIEAWFKEHSDA